MVHTGRARAIIIIVFAAASLVSCSSYFEPKEPTAPPKPPKNVRVQIDEAGVKISWDCVKGATKYSVFWGREESRDYRGLRDADGCSLILAGLVRGFIYRFAVTAWNRRGESNYSREVAIVFDNDQQKSDYYVLRGEHMWKKGRYQAAHIFFSTAIRLDPKNPEPYKRRAALNRQLNRSELARHDLDMVEKLSNPKAH